MLLYGDAVAHINIARRVFDSKTPGLLQLGTVWLPLPHLLMIPFIVSTRMWQSGAGGSIPSMAAFVLGVLGIFRLVRDRAEPRRRNRGRQQDRALGRRDCVWRKSESDLHAGHGDGRVAVSGVVHLGGGVFHRIRARQDRSRHDRLTKCGLCLAAACLTRYDGWFLAVVLVVAALSWSSTSGNVRKKRRSVSSLRIGAGEIRPDRGGAPALWLAYNAVVYRNPLEFANGPYSAKAIEQKTATVNPAKGNLCAAASYFLKAAELNVAEANWQGRLWLALAWLDSLGRIVDGRGCGLRLLLWMPLPFYALSVAYGGVPIFVPTWWPFSHYNVRYGLQLLPAFAVFVPLGISFLVQSAAIVFRVGAFVARWAGAATFLAVVLLGVASYGSIWRADPICFREAAINTAARVAAGHATGAAGSNRCPPNSTLLMYLGEHVGRARAGGHSVAAHDQRRQSSRVETAPDPEGLWERALADPAEYADYVVGFEGDPVWQPARDQPSDALVEIHTTGQPQRRSFQLRKSSALPKAHAVIRRVNAQESPAQSR